MIEGLRHIINDRCSVPHRRKMSNKQEMKIKDKNVQEHLHRLNQFLSNRGIKTKSVDELIDYLLSVEVHYRMKNGYYRKED